LGSIIGRGCGIHPKRHDDWLVVPNLWGAVVGRPSLMKTPAVSEAQKHLSRLETEARDDYKKAAAAFEIDKEVLKLTKATIGEEIKKALKQGKDIEEARGKLAALQDDEPTRRRYQTQDGTTEKIGELLNQNPRGLLINRDELIGWFRSLDRDGREGDRAFYLEAWNGNRGFTYDRIGRGTLDISALCASVFGAITPGPLSSYVYQANRGGNGDDGLLQRFQVLVWPDAPNEWRNVDRFPNTVEKSRAWGIFKALSGEIPGAVSEAGADIPALRFSPQGQYVFDTWRNGLETRLRSDHGLQPAMESHLTKYRKLMPSLSLIFHLVAVADGAPPGPVSETAAQMAAAWCEYLESHAGRIYGGATKPGMDAAREIVKHIQRGAIQDGCKPKDIYRNQWSRLTTPEEVKAGLEVLEEYDWLSVATISTGGRPSEIVTLNPHIRL
jgi:putative DNA primase/helicase